MSFKWDRVYKAEEYFDSLITEYAMDYIIEHYSLEDIEELTYEQMKEIEQWEFDESPYIMGIGIRNVINMAESRLAELIGE
mgnify:CR=1 FL=1